MSTWEISRRSLNFALLASCFHTISHFPNFHLVGFPKPFFVCIQCEFCICSWNGTGQISIWIYQHISSFLRKCSVTASHSFSDLSSTSSYFISLKSFTGNVFPKISLREPLSNSISLTLINTSSLK